MASDDSSEPSGAAINSTSLAASTLTLEEVASRLCYAMDEPVTDAWLVQAETNLRRHANMKRKRKLYDVSTVGARIQTAREIMGMTRSQLAARLGVFYGTVKNWEQGKQNIPAKKFAGLCMSLGVTRPWMLGETVEGGPPLPDQVIRRSVDPKWLGRDRYLRENARAEAKMAAVKERVQAAILASKTIPATRASAPSGASGGSDGSQGSDVRRGEGRDGEDHAGDEHGRGAGAAR